MLYVEMKDPEFQLSNDVRITPSLGLHKARAIMYDQTSANVWYYRLFANYLSPSTPLANQSRQRFLDSLDIANHEANMMIIDQYQVDPLDELRASHALGGPFRLVLLPKSSDHLMYEDSIDGPIIKLLGLDVIVNTLAVLQLIGFTG